MLNIIKLELQNLNSLLDDAYLKNKREPIFINE